MNLTSYVKTRDNIPIPRIIYGTAWKKEDTTRLVCQAVRKGFRGIDTACQPKHYREDLVGDALVLLQKEGFNRESLFVQTKFTSYNGQDPTRCPYDPNLPLQEQVRQSFAQSLKNLKTTYVDSLVLHSPLDTHSANMEVWRIFEEFHSLGKVKVLGISNIYSLKTLKQIYNDAQIKPSVIQNRFYKRTNYDHNLREFCLDNQIWYQSFWTLTANPKIVHSELLLDLAQKYQKTPEQIFFRFVMKLGIIPLSGTKDPVHIQQDLEVASLSFQLSAKEVESIDELLFAQGSEDSQ